MVFHAKETRIPDDVAFSFNNNDVDSTNIPELIHPIERISNNSKIPAFKILGVYLDENLSFDYHFQRYQDLCIIYTTLTLAYRIS